VAFAATKNIFAEQTMLIVVNWFGRLTLPIILMDSFEWMI